ncbi:spore coat [Brachionus plicatilis]|uniref:Spore coat n=1 Tax=Brachionus plicatilis TaxID=10195 RepID=A0A3M7PRV7_BRAPC|nr:spore coat [Brachionus plicatilis]
MQSILRSGFGCLIQKNTFEKLSGKYLKGLLMDKGFVLVKNLDYSDKKLVDMCKGFGQIVNHDQEKKVGYGYKDVFKLDGTKNKIVNGREILPLHADGGLVQTRVDHVFLYANEIENLKFQGATTVVDLKLALEEMPPHLKRVLDEETFESNVFDREYYSEASPKNWFKVPVFKDYGWTRQFYCYFNFDENFSNPGWETRILGFSRKETDNFFKELDDFFREYRYCYTHMWQKGDLLIMDNRNSIHAREPFDDVGKRIISRVQTIED